MVAVYVWLWLYVDRRILRKWRYTMSSYVKTSKHSLQNIINIWNIDEKKIQENGGKKISISCVGQFQFDAIHFMSSSILFHDQFTDSFLHCLHPVLVNYEHIARLNDVRGISILSAKIGERRKRVTAHVC